MNYLEELLKGVKIENEEHAKNIIPILACAMIDNDCPGAYFTGAPGRDKKSYCGRDCSCSECWKGEAEK